MDGNGIALQAASASIVTASVTIKALKVDNRQLTQSVFKQLPERKLVDDLSIKLLGEPWGWVNYRTADMGEGRQFVAQFGDKLCRCPLPMIGDVGWDFWDRANQPAFFWEIGRHFDDLRKAWLIASCLDGSISADALGVGQPFMGRPEAHPNVRIEVFVALCRDEVAKVSIYDFRPDADFSDLYRHVKNCLCGGDKLPVDHSRNFLTNRLQRFGLGNPSPAGLLIVMEALNCEAESLWCRWNALIDQLAAVEQLYIAT